MWLPPKTVEWIGVNLPHNSHSYVYRHIEAAIA